jgi:hypothetical protein
MAIDLFLWANTKADLLTWAKTNPPAAPLFNASNEPVSGVAYVWWGGHSGKLMTAKGTYNGLIELTPPTFLTGFVVLIRLYREYFDADKINAGGEQWARSKVVKYIKDNGTPGTVAGGSISYYQLGAVRIFRPADVTAWLAANNLPGHEWFGGNSY